MKDEPTNPTAFILGKYATGGLGTVRCFGRKRVKTIWIDSNKNQIGFKSRYCKGLVCPNPKNFQENYVEFLIKTGEKLNQKGVLFPIGDIEAGIILKNKSKLEKYFYFTSADFDVTEKLLNKKLFYKTLEKIGIAHPKTFFPSDSSDVERISDCISYPCILKPVHSALFVIDFNIKLYVVQNSIELKEIFKQVNQKNHDVMIQEIIPGNVRNMHGFNAYYDKNYSSNGIFMYRRIREWPQGFGNGCFIENVFAPELEEIVTSLVKKIKYYGIVDAEFRKDPRDDKFKLIEINPRCWMQISFPERLGVNLPYIAYLDAQNKKFDNPTARKGSYKYLYFVEDFSSAIKSISNKELKLKDWIKSYMGKKDYALFSWDDPMPFFALISNGIFSFKNKN